MSQTAEIVQALGGTKVLRREISSLEELKEKIREGLPYAAVERLVANFGLSTGEICDALDLPARTMARRKKERKLRPDESDRLFRLARIAAEAAEVLGGDENASRWLHRPNRALGGKTPLAVLDTDIGARQVEAVLGRIEHGVFS